MPTIPHDKALHFIYGTLIFCVSYLATFQWFQEPLWAAMALVALFAIGKEVADYWSNQQAIKQKILPTHGVEVMDAVATIAGGLVVAIPLCVKYLV